VKRLTVVGCGWFGRPFARHMAERGWSVKGSVRDADRAQALSAEGVEGFAFDLADTTYPAKAFSEAIVVVAISPGRLGESRRHYYEGMALLLDEAAAQGARGLVVITSTSVYRGVRGEVDEATPPPNPENHLVRVERHLTRLPTPSCAVRFGGLIGPDRHPGRFLADRAEVTGGGDPVNLVQLDDCVRALEHLADTDPAAWPERINVVAPEHPNRASFYRAASESLGLAPPTFADVNSTHGRVVRCTWLESQGFEFSPLQP
jgi:nucleoside-diphosphate-sugar epimerase